MKENLGCETNVFGIKMFTTCDDCHYEYGLTQCERFRKDPGSKLGFVIEG